MKWVKLESSFVILQIICKVDSHLYPDIFLSLESKMLRLEGPTKYQKPKYVENFKFSCTSHKNFSLQSVTHIFKKKFNVSLSRQTNI